MHTLAMLVGLAAGSAVVPNEYVIDVRVCDGDPAGSVNDGTIRVLGRDAVTAAVGETEFLPIAESSQRDMTLSLRLAARLNVTPRRTPAGLTLAIDGPVLARPVRPARGGPTVDALPVREVLPTTPGRPVRHTVATRSATDQTWLEVSVRPAK